MKQKFTVLVVREGDGNFSAVFPFHNLTASGRTQEEALASARELIAMQLESMAEDGDELFLHVADAREAQLTEIEADLSERVEAVATEQASRWVRFVGQSQRRAS